MTTLALAAALLLSPPQAEPLPAPRPPTPLPPVPTVQVLRPYSGTAAAAPNTWAGLSGEDLLARMMLSEQSYKVLDPELDEDAIGAAWVAINRLDPEHGFVEEGQGLWHVLARGQFAGLTWGMAYAAADPETYWSYFAVSDESAGRRAYWRARGLVWGIKNGLIEDPTGGALYFADRLLVGEWRHRTAFWEPGEAHLTIPERDAARRLGEEG